MVECIDPITREMFYNYMDEYGWVNSDYGYVFSWRVVSNPIDLALGQFFRNVVVPFRPRSGL